MADKKELLARFKGDTKDLEKSTDRAKRSIREYSGEAERGNKKVNQSFLNAGKAATLAAAAFAGIKALNMADEFTLLEARVKNSTKTTEEFTKAFDGLKESSKETGVNLKSSVEVFQRLSLTRKEIGATVDEMLLFTDTVNKLGVVSGASTGALNAALVQLGQGLSAGVLRAEEFNSVVENTPIVAKAIADEFGISTGKLKLLVNEGEVLSKDVFNAINNQAAKANEQFEKMPKTLGRSFSGLVQTVTEAGRGLIEFTRINKIAIGLMDRLSNTVSKVANLTGLIGAGFELAFIDAREAFNDFTVFFRDQYFANIDPVIMKLNKDMADAIANNVSQIRDINFDGMRAEVIDRSTQSLNNFTEKSKELNTETKEIVKNYQSLAEGLTETDEKSKKASKSTSDLTGEVRKIRQETDRFANSTAETFSQFISGSLSAREALRGLINDLQQFLIRKTITSQVSGLLGTAIGGFTGLGSAGNGFAFGGSSASIASNGAPIPGVKPTVASFNSGGSFQVKGMNGVDRNALSLNGKQIANVSKGETVSVGRGGQGVTVNQTVNLSTGVSETVRSEFAKILPQLKENTIAAVKDAQQRGRL